MRPPGPWLVLRQQSPQNLFCYECPPRSGRAFVPLRASPGHRVLVFPQYQAPTWRSLWVCLRLHLCSLPLMGVLCFPQAPAPGSPKLSEDPYPLPYPHPLFRDHPLPVPINFLSLYLSAPSWIGGICYLSLLYFPQKFWGYPSRLHSVKGSGFGKQSQEETCLRPLEPSSLYLLSPQAWTQTSLLPQGGNTRKKKVNI